MGPPTSVLLLAGSAEASALAHLLHGRGIPLVASLAGHTRSPAPLPCPVRTGGFGGIEGLVAALREGGHRVLVDATHPFAAGMAAHASAAAGRAGVPRLRVLRPPWVPGPGDEWHEVDDLDAAARALAIIGTRRVFLALGRRHLAPFASLSGVHAVVRSIEPTDDDLPVGTEVVTARPPFTVDGELDLLRSNAVDTIVTRNSGAAATAAKLVAARTLGVRVVMVRRPPPPPGPVVADAAAALRWVESVTAAEEPLYPSRVGRGDE
jgi:precorrin-6A/cobalt-precorrin-6A reductase